MTEYSNRLSKEKSPYLLQHAHNPVDWYPWGEEAFDRAREEDKPIFLSIGYATCHWCHVMAHESFENPEIAARLNNVFVNIKVDREELPEIDSLYMEFAQALMTSGGGWPLNVLLTPDLKPFYAVTYLPPEEGHGMMGLMDLINHIQELWHSEEKELLFDQANRLVDFFEKAVTTQGKEVPGEALLEEALEVLFDSVDPIYGGLKEAPKFPLGYQCQFYLNYAKIFADPRSLFLAEKTLEMMQRGGIYDHIGGGFSRYSVDEKWFVPHFEKMLYDNAFLAAAYLDAYRLTQKAYYKDICQEILDYVLREMSHKEGGFYTAEDADTEGIEGAYYLWTKKEIASLLSKEEADLFCTFYDITDQGNFEGKNILHCPLSIEEFVHGRSLDLTKVQIILTNALKKVREARSKRKRPFKDDKILVSWNALMIDAFVKAGCAFKHPAYVEAGVKGINFIRNNFWKEGQLLRRFREGEVNFEASLDDYTSLIRALITLYEAGQGQAYLDWALELTSLLKKNYKANGGAFYLTTPNSSILLRRCELYDSAQPSGNALHTENLLRLYQITYERDYWIQAEDILKVAKHFIDAYPQGACYHLLNLLRFLDKKAATLIIAFNDKKTLKQEEILFSVYSKFIPHLCLSFKESAVDYPLIEGKVTFYLCRYGKCLAPTTDWSEIEKALVSL